MKKNKLLKALALFLSAIMLLFVFASCGSEAPKQSEEENNLTEQNEKKWQNFINDLINKSEPVYEDDINGNQLDHYLLHENNNNQFIIYHYDYQILILFKEFSTPVIDYGYNSNIAFSHYKGDYDHFGLFITYDPKRDCLECNGFWTCYDFATTIAEAQVNFDTNNKKSFSELTVSSGSGLSVYARNCGMSEANLGKLIKDRAKEAMQYYDITASKYGLSFHQFGFSYKQ